MLKYYSKPRKSYGPKRKRDDHISLERLRELLAYDPQTGILTWRVSRGSNAKKGTSAGYCRADGYLRVRVDGQDYLVHRLAYFHHTGELPPLIDHANAVSSDNRFCNLRPATPSQNQANRRATKPLRSSAFKGVTRAGPNRFVAKIVIRGKTKHLGSFRDELAACAAYEIAAVEAFGEFARPT